MNVVLVDYGAGNLRSVASALRRAGGAARVTTDPAAVRAAPLAVIAGVGHTDSAARGLAAAGLDEALSERASAGRPILGVCVGMQLLFGESEEGGSGIGLLEGRVVRLQARHVPHMGWNALRATRASALLAGCDGEDVYFAHSYAAVPSDPLITAATVDHGGPVVAAVESGPLAGLQFHPERSGRAGARVLENALAWSRSV